MTCRYEVQVNGKRKSFKTRTAANRHAKKHCGAIRRVCSNTAKVTKFKSVPCRVGVRGLGAVKKKTRKNEQADWERLVDERVAERESIAAQTAPLIAKANKLLDEDRFAEAKVLLAQVERIQADARKART